VSDSTQMNKAKNQNLPDDSGVLTRFFLRYGKVLIVFSLVLLATVIGVVIFNEIQKNRISQGTILVETLEEDYIDFLMSEKETEDPDPILGTIDKISRQFPNTFFHQRALLIQGLLFEGKEDFEEAARSFFEISRIPIDSHLVEVGLIRGYQNYEAAGNLEMAISTLEELIRLRPDGIQAPRSMFNLGRLYEELAQNELALDQYQRLLIKFPSSSWTNLAQARIIFLER